MDFKNKTYSNYELKEYYSEELYKAGYSYSKEFDKFFFTNFREGLSILKKFDKSTLFSAATGDVLGAIDKFHFPKDSDLKHTVIVGIYNLSQHISGHGPAGEKIINEPIANISEKIFEDFINLVDPRNQLIHDESILDFSEKYGLLIMNPYKQTLYKNKYHVEPLSFWKNEISLMHSITKAYYYYRLVALEPAAIKVLESLFNNKKGKFYYYDDSYKSLKNDIKPINFLISTGDMFDKHGSYDKFENFYEQFVVDLFVSALKPRLRISADSKLKQVEIQKKYQQRDFVWFDFEKEYHNLYSYMWLQFANFIRDRGTFKICENCRKYFVSKVIQRGRFCSDNCRSSKGREMEIWNKVHEEFTSKGYATHMSMDDATVASKKFSDYFSRLNLRADVGLFHEKTLKLVALLEFKYSDITNKSPKFKYVSEQIMKYLNLMHKYEKLNHAFVINKNRQIFFWDLDKKIYGEEIKSIPHVDQLKQSDHQYKVKK